jgi:Rrf2 family protein
VTNLLRISEAGNLGVHALADLALDVGATPRSVGAIAGRLNVSPAHLAKVLQRLAKRGLIRSTRGPGGGFVLARAADTIPLMEVLDAIDGPFKTEGCLLGRSLCPPGGCVFKDVAAFVREQLTSKTVASFRAFRPVGRNIG